MTNDNKIIQDQQLQIDLNLDSTPVLYTDNVISTTNNQGVVLNFGQMMGPTNKTRIVSRIGMSREHAKEFIKQLGNLVAMTDGQVQTVQNKN